MKLSFKFFVVLILICLFVIWGQLNFGFASTDDWIFTDFKNRVMLNSLNSTLKSKSDYAVDIEITDIDLIAQFHNNCSDIRFASTSEKLNYYVDTCLPKKVIVHVKLKALNTGDNKFYLYYSNPSVVSESNGKNTFEYFEDFDNFNPTIKFGLITDIHHDANSKRIWTSVDFEDAYLSDARARLQNFINQINSWGADFIIELGDLITAEDWTGTANTEGSDNCSNSEYCQIDNNEVVETHNEAMNALTQIESIYKKFNGPRYYVFSNHEFYNISMSEFFSNVGGQGAVENTPGITFFTGNSVDDIRAQTNSIEKFANYYYFDKGGVRFVTIDTQYKPKYNDATSANNNCTNIHWGKTRVGNSDYGIGCMNDEQKIWLDNVLKTSPFPVVVFSPSRIDDTDYLTAQQCSNPELLKNYCTTNLNSQMCSDFSWYRGVLNKNEIRSILEFSKDKILAVFQGNDHSYFRSIHNGINYITVNDATQSDPKNISYLKVQLDPVSKLMAIQSSGEEKSSYVIDYKNKKLHIGALSENMFIPAPIKSNLLENDLMIQADWEINPNAPAQQIAVGFWKDADFSKIMHRCATTGRNRIYNIAGIRRVYANSGANNYIGYEVSVDGNKKTTLIDQNSDTSGRFSSLYSDSFLYFSYLTSTKVSEIPKLNTKLQGFSPGVWIFDNTDGYIDNLIIRKAVYPKVVTSISGEIEQLGDFTGDRMINGLDFNILAQSIFKIIGVDSSFVVDINNDGLINLMDFIKLLNII